MQLFYSSNIKDNLIYLDKAESHHCIHVLRKVAGDIITIIDGKGHFIEARILSQSAKELVAEIVSIKPDSNTVNSKLHIAIAPTKNIDRFEWFLEKSTELGIKEITPLLCRHSERKIINAERCSKILLSAIKQSHKAFLPILNPLTTYNSFLSNQFASQKFIAHCGDTPKVNLQDIDTSIDVVVLIGPEGDFNNEEIELAHKMRFVDLSLGNSRLRTETAGVYVCAAFNLFSNKL